MPRYLVERTFTVQVNLPAPGQDPSIGQRFLENNGLDEVTWLFSYVAPESNKSYCICDAPTPEAVRRAARRNHLPIDRIVEVQVLAPYSYSV
jgi:hypothetical protein